MKTYIDTISGETLYLSEKESKTQTGKGYCMVGYFLDEAQIINHRVDGPAYICKWDNGWTDENWWQNNQLHRLDGPATIDNIGFSWHIEGHLICAKYRSQCKTNLPRIFKKALKEHKLKVFN